MAFLFTFVINNERNKFHKVLIFSELRAFRGGVGVKSSQESCGANVHFPKKIFF